MKKTIALIDKAPNKTDYSKYLPFDFDHYHLSSVPIKKLLKKDIDIDIDIDLYDLIILVGAEASKHFAKVTSVTSMAGQLIDERFVCLTNPAMLSFKPEGLPDFQRAIARLLRIYNGESEALPKNLELDAITSTEIAKEYIKQVLKEAKDIVAWDTETTALYPRDGYILGLSLTYKDNKGAYIITDCLDDECISLLQQIAYTFTAVFHNLKFDKKFIEYHLEIKFDRVEDTMLMHYALDENSSHSLKELALKYTDFGDYDRGLQEFKDNYCKTHGILKEDFTYDLIPFEIIAPYAAIDTCVTYALYNKFKPLLEKNELLYGVYKNILIEGSLALLEFEEVGIPVSKERLELADAYLQQEIELAKQHLYSFEEIVRFEASNGKIFNPNSVIQLRTLLFDYLNLDATGIKTDTGQDSTNAEALQQLADQHPVPAAILNIRKLTKLQNTYTTKLKQCIDRDGRIRTNFSLHVTTSGRLSSSGKFNAQQIPRDDPIIKGCIVAPQNYSIVSQDLITAEVYKAAVLSGDKVLQSVFLSGEDLHGSIAKEVFHLTCLAKDVKSLFPKLRQAAKAITFGILFGSGPAKVAETVTKETGEYYSIEEAKENIKDYFSRFKTLKKWLDTQKAFIEKYGYVYSAFGRKRRLKNVFSEDRGIAAHEIRSGINMLIQSVASDVNLLAAIDTKKEIQHRKLDAKIFMLVHDSIVALVRDDCIEEYTEILARNTQKDRGVSIPGCPIGIDVEIGKDYSFGKFEKTYEIRGNKLARI